MNHQYVGLVEYYADDPRKHISKNWLKIDILYQDKKKNPKNQKNPVHKLQHEGWYISRTDI